ncbi:hypothetical protein E2562_014841 [Oryza meyeriana var. granulata]|uniref:Uncharacterized protein n=1 Tax=Oryza meyeriana var. granulata TaxID=110450 RepID=A0A6G1BWG2_9ORYZ|nr:hypothetical protein E2562_014841 [Oryza meyeriana var. granulata]
MDFHALPRRDLQALCKRNGVRANMTNAAMAEALAKLPTVDGIDEFVKQPVALPAPVTKSAVKAVAEEDPREKKESPLPRGRRVTFSSPELIKLDNSDEEVPGENKVAPLPRGRRGTVRSSKLIRPDDEEEKQDPKRDANEPALGDRPREASRRAPAAPVVVPTTRRRAAAASKNETGDVVAEAAPAPTTRRRAQSAVPAPAEEKVSRGRRTTRRAAARKPDIQEEEEDYVEGAVSVVESTEPAPVSDAGCDDTDEVEEAEPLSAEQNGPSEEPVQEEEGIEVEAPAETVEAVAQECSPDAVVEGKPVQEEEGIEVEAPAETVEAIAHELSPSTVLEEKQVDVEQPISQDDSPILGLVSGAIVGDDEEAHVCNSKWPMDMVTEESSDVVSGEKEAMPADEVPQATVTCSEATGDAEFPTDVGDAKEEEDEMDAVDEVSFAVEENGAETVDELNGTLTEYADNAIRLNFSAEVSCADEEAGVVATDVVLQSSATVKSMVTGSEANEEEDALEEVDEIGFAVEEKGVETVDEPHDTLSDGADNAIQLDFSGEVSCAIEGEGVAASDDLLQSSKTMQDEPHDTLSNDADSAILLEEDALEAINEVGFAVEEKGVETVDEPHDTLSDGADNAIQLDFSGEVSCAVEGEGVAASEDLVQSSKTMQDEPQDTLSNDADSAILLEEDALEAINEVGFAVEEKGVETVDKPHDILSDGADNAIQLDFSEEVSCAVERERVVASEDLLQSSETTQYDFKSEICDDAEHNEMVTCERVSSEEGISEENVFTDDLTLKFDGPGDLGDHNTSAMEEGAETLPLSTEMPNNVTDPLPTMVTVAEEMVSEAIDVSSDCMHGSSNKKDSNEVKVVQKQEDDPVELAKLSLRTLRAKLKEKMIGKHKREEAKRVALARLDENVC